jgi:hypothetical protein
MNQKTFLILLFIASLCLGFYFYIDRFKATVGSQTEVAKIIEFSGSVFINESDKVETPRELKNLDTFTTKENSDALLSFIDGSQLRVFENTNLIISKEVKQKIINLNYGEVQFEELPKDSDSILISINNKRYNARDFEFEYKKNKHILIKNENTLTQDSIQQTLSAHKQDFYRCYLKALQKNPGLTGQATMQFQIERSGKVLAPQLNLQMNLQTQNNSELKECLIEILDRIQFKSFTGEAITATFPLRFE